MEKVVLQSMTDFVLEQSKTGMEVQSLSHQLQNRADRFEKIVRYAKFLKQPLTLGMFVPCDLDGNVLKIIPFHEHKQGSTFEFMQHKLYEEAKERVIFSDCKINVYNNAGSFELLHENGFPIGQYKALPNYFLWLGGSSEQQTLEDLLKYKIDFILTETAKKQIGLI